MAGRSAASFRHVTKKRPAKTRTSGAPPGKPTAPKAAPKARLAVLMDGEPLADDDARALWTAFSAHMDDHQGDLAGFAKQKGWTSVKPEHRAGQAVLVVTT